MSSQIAQAQKWALASVALRDAYTDFILSRQAMLCSPATVKWYAWTLDKFLGSLNEKGITKPDEISARDVRAYLSEIAGRELSDSYIHNNARAIRTFLKFLHAENYIPAPVSFKMPGLAQKRLPALTASQVKAVLASCDNARDLALVMVMVDSGIRRAELLAMNWGDMDIESGLVRIPKGKGGKSRSVVVGINTRRALLKYRRTINHDEGSPLFQSRSGKRYSFNGLRSALLRIGKSAGVKFSPHMLRRTFATLSLRAGMNVLHLQGLLGHSSLEMTRRYVQMLDGDLLIAHQQHGPIDNL